MKTKKMNLAKKNMLLWYLLIIIFCSSNPAQMQAQKKSKSESNLSDDYQRNFLKPHIFSFIFPSPNLGITYERILDDEYKHAINVQLAYLYQQSFGSFWANGTSNNDNNNAIAEGARIKLGYRYFVENEGKYRMGIDVKVGYSGINTPFEYVYNTNPTGSVISNTQKERITSLGSHYFFVAKVGKHSYFDMEVGMAYVRYNKTYAQSFNPDKASYVNSNGDKLNSWYKWGLPVEPQFSFKYSIGL
jgi:hypothetical protein